MGNFRVYLRVKHFYSSQHRNTIGKKKQPIARDFGPDTAHSHDDLSKGVQSTVKHAIKVHLLLGAECLFLTLWFGQNHFEMSQENASNWTLN